MKFNYNINDNLGDRIKQRRSILKITQKELAEILKISPSQLSNYENGKSGISISMLYKISEVLKTPVSFFYDNMMKSSFAEEREGYLECEPTENEIKELISLYSKVLDYSKRKKIMKYIQDKLLEL